MNKPKIAKNMVAGKPQRQGMPGWIRWVLLAAVAVAAGLFMARPIDLTTADLGRHIMNGRVFLEHFTPVKTNFYSYTEPALPVVNHHWGTGVLYALVYQVGGFTGLSLFNILVFVAAVLLFFRAAVRRSSFAIALFCLALALPLLASRAEVRPEIISYLMLALLLNILDRRKEGPVSVKRIVAVALLMLAWVNLHIFFVMGLFLVLAWLGGSILRKDRDSSKEYGLMALASLVAALFNPSGIHGLTEPFMIFREYGYMIAENQPLWFMQSRFPWILQYIHFEFLAIVALIVLGAWVVSDRRHFTVIAAPMAVLLVFMLLGFGMIRMMPLFGFMFVPVAAEGLNRILGGNTGNPVNRIVERVAVAAGGLILALSLLTGIPYLSATWPVTGLGWDRAADGSARFFRENGIRGPVFNNYDIGGYLIFNFFPVERVFVDNRPEAYTVPFFRELYEPMQASEEKWNAADMRFNFNAIFFNRLDQTPNAQPFLIRRIADPRWAVVFVDERTLILLKRNETNQEVISRNEIPASAFGIASPEKK